MTMITPYDVIGWERVKAPLIPWQLGHTRNNNKTGPDLHSQ